MNPAMALVAGVPNDANIPELWKFWTELRNQITPFNNVIAIQGPRFRTLDYTKINWLGRQFKDIIDDEVLFVRDFLLDRVFLGPMETFNGACRQDANGAYQLINPAEMLPHLANALNPARAQATSDQLGAVSVPRIPRPANAFILYRVDHHESVKAANPGIHNNMISKIIGAQWGLEKIEVVNMYKDKAAKIKMEHAEKYPGYQYQPRTPGQKKRRAKKLAPYVVPVDISTMTGAHDTASIVSLPVTRGDVNALNFHNRQIIAAAAGQPVVSHAPVYLGEPSRLPDLEINTLGNIPWDAIRIIQKEKCINPAELLA